MSPFVPHKTTRTDSQALPGFVDREHLRSQFMEAYDSLSKGGPYDGLVLDFYGVGGFGKSTLLAQLRKDLAAKAASQGARTALIAKYNFEEEGSCSKLQLIRALATQLFRTDDKHFKFYRVRSAFLAYSELTGQSMALPEKNSTFDSNPFAAMLEAAEPAASAVVEATKALPFIGMIPNIISAIITTRKAIKEAANSKAMEEYLLALQEADNLMIDKKLEAWFIDDVRDALDDGAPGPIVIFLDTMEKLTRAIAENRQDDFWLRELVSNTPGVLWVLAGREKLEWDHVSSYDLDNFERNYSDDYLREAGITDEGLLFGLYGLTRGNPMYLSLCVKTYRRHLASGGDAVPDIGIFGKETADLVRLYIGNEDPETRELANLLSCLRHWTEEEARRIALLSEMPWTYERYADFMKNSFITTNERGGSSYMHEIVQRAIYDNIPSADFKNRVNRQLYEHCREMFEEAPGIEMPKALHGMARAFCQLDPVPDKKSTELLRHVFSCARSLCTTLFYPNALQVARMLHSFVMEKAGDAYDPWKAVACLGRADIVNRCLWASVCSGEKEDDRVFVGHEERERMERDMVAYAQKAFGYVSDEMVEAYEARSRWNDPMAPTEMECDNREQIYRIRLAQFGPDHPKTREAAQRLVEACKGTERAQLLFAATSRINIWERFGAEDTLIFQLGSQPDKREDGAADKAHEERMAEGFKAELQGIEEKYGRTDPRILACQDKLAYWLEKAGDFQEATDVRKAALDGYESAFGAASRATVEAGERFVQTLARCGGKEQVLPFVQARDEFSHPSDGFSKLLSSLAMGLGGPKEWRRGFELVEWEAEAGESGAVKTFAMRSGREAWSYGLHVIAEKACERIRDSRFSDAWAKASALLEAQGLPAAADCALSAYDDVDVRDLLFDGIVFRAAKSDGAGAVSFAYEKKGEAYAFAVPFALAYGGHTAECEEAFGRMAEIARREGSGIFEDFSEDLDTLVRYLCDEGHHDTAAYVAACSADEEEFNRKALDAMFGRAVEGEPEHAAGMMRLFSEGTRADAATDLAHALVLNASGRVACQFARCYCEQEGAGFGEFIDQVKEELEEEGSHRSAEELTFWAAAITGLS